MSAPNKHGLDYFPHDIDLSNDQKIEYVEAEIGIIGYAMYLKLLEKIYRVGYFLKWNERDSKLFAKHNNIEVNVCINGINVIINEGLFHKDLHKKYGVLTSKSVQKRYIEANSRRKEIKFYKQFALLDCKKVINVYKNLIIVDINLINVDINPVIVEQSKVKESKYKVKEKKKDILSDKSDQRNNKIDYEWYKDFWNLQANTLPIIKGLSKERKIKLKTRIKNNKQFKEEFEKCILKIQQTPFLLGENDRKWQVDFDWVIDNDTHYLKILEGKYGTNNIETQKEKESREHEAFMAKYRKGPQYED